MYHYKPGDHVGELAEWPFTNASSRYQITEGNPQASGRIDTGGSGHTTRFGIWHCTRGTFDCTEQGDELMTILSGRCRLVHHELGKTFELLPGDSLFLQDGSRVTWEIKEAVTKVFHGYLAGGY